jgi:hypothetical protein
VGFFNLPFAQMFVEKDAEKLGIKKNLLSCLLTRNQHHRFLIEVDCSLVIKHNSKLNYVQTIQMSQVFLALLSSSEPIFE